MRSAIAPERLASLPRALDLEVAGDYLVIPRGVTYRFAATKPNVHLVIESAGEIELPERGMLGRHAQFDPMVMRTPKLAEAEKKTGKNAPPLASSITPGRP